MPRWMWSLLAATCLIGCAEDEPEQDAPAKEPDEGLPAPTGCTGSEPKVACYGYDSGSGPVTCIEGTGDAFLKEATLDTFQTASCFGEEPVKSCSTVSVFGRCFYSCGETNESVVFSYTAEIAEGNRMNCLAFDGIWEE